MSKNNTLQDLNTYLFDQMERLSKAKGEDLKKEIDRANAINGVALNIIGNANTQIKLCVAMNRMDDDSQFFPKLLGDNDE